MSMQGVIRYRQYSGGRSRPAAVVRDAPEGALLELAGMPVQGKGAIALVEFSDYECPFCGRHAGDVGKNLRKDFVETGNVQHFFANKSFADAQKRSHVGDRGNMCWLSGSLLGNV